MIPRVNAQKKKKGRIPPKKGQIHPIGHLLRKEPGRRRANAPHARRAAAAFAVPSPAVRVAASRLGPVISPAPDDDINVMPFTTLLSTQIAEWKKA